MTMSGLTLALINNRPQQEHFIFITLMNLSFKFTHYEYFGMTITQINIVVMMTKGSQVLMKAHIFTYLPQTNIHPASFTMFQLEFL